VSLGIHSIWALTKVQGPQIDEEQQKKILRLIEQGKKEGAKLVTAEANTATRDILCSQQYSQVHYKRFISQF
jgi:acyl-CoA reductase-like NAD-dependent aldehyde dehydrogenase